MERSERSKELSRLLSICIVASFAFGSGIKNLWNNIDALPDFGAILGLAVTVAALGVGIAFGNRARKIIETI